MAGDWIKMRNDLWTHPKFIALTKLLVYGDGEGSEIGFLTYVCGDLGVGSYPCRNESVTSLALQGVTMQALRCVTMAVTLRVWCSVNAHCKVVGSDAICSPMTLSDLDEIAGFQGYGEALAVVGWVTEDRDNDSLIFKNFCEHNSPASLRNPPLTNAERQAKHRAKLKQVSERVTGVTKSNAREEKRREEKNKEEEGGKNGTRFVPPTPDEVSEYCRERGNRVDPSRFHDFYTAKGWVVGKSKMKDWRAAVRNWEKSDTEKPVRSIFAGAK